MTKTPTAEAPEGGKSRGSSTLCGNLGWNTRPERPGIYGFPEEAELDWTQPTTIDLIVPEAYAGAGGAKARSARMPGQEKAASRARGLEIALRDRTLMTLPALDDSGDSIDVHVAGSAALLIVKAHKVGERMAEFKAHPDRVKAKDSGDVALLMMVSTAQIAPGR